MAKSKKKTEVEVVVAKSTYEIYIDSVSTFINSKDEAERKYRNAVGREPISCYFYRHDWDENDNLIETYMIG
jgi:hypothetical protein